MALKRDVKTRPMLVHVAVDVQDELRTIAVRDGQSLSTLVEQGMKIVCKSRRRKEQKTSAKS